MESRTVTAVGVCFYCVKTNRYLYLMRNDAKHPNTWGLPGGKMLAGETLLDTLSRECNEELGAMPDYLQLIPLEKFTSNDQHFIYSTFWCSVENEFVPELNDEHIGWAWIKAGNWPRPMHPGLWNTLSLDAVQLKINQVENSLQSTYYNFN